MKVAIITQKNVGGIEIEASLVAGKKGRGQVLATARGWKGQAIGQAIDGLYKKAEKMGYEVVQPDYTQDSKGRWVIA